MNKGEWGVAIRVGVGYDISGFSSLTMIFSKPGGTSLTVTDADGVTAPNTAASGFSADEYFEYTTADGDIDEAGTWSVCTIYEDAQKKLVGDTVVFTVGSGCEA